MFVEASVDGALDAYIFARPSQPVRSSNDSGVTPTPTLMATAAAATSSSTLSRQRQQQQATSSINNKNDTNNSSRSNNSNSRNKNKTERLDPQLTCMLSVLTPPAPSLAETGMSGRAFLCRGGISPRPHPAHPLHLADTQRHHEVGERLGHAGHVIPRRYWLFRSLARE